MECSVYQVAKSGDIEFLQKGVDMSEILSQETIQRKDNLLHIAANWLQVEFAKETIRLNLWLLSRRNSKCDSPLHVA